MQHPRHDLKVDAPLTGSLLLLALLLGGGSLLLRPDRHLGAEALLFGDQGYNLWAVDRILAGERLYADVAFQYGPLPAYAHAAFAVIFGNSAHAFNAFFLLVTLVNVALATLLMRRVASRSTTAIVVGLGLTASLLVPGSLLGGTTNAVYVVVERTLLLLAALLWCRPWARSVRRAVAIGVVIGAWQWVRFGGGVFLGVALVLTDLLALAWARGVLDPGAFARWVRSVLVTAGSAATVAVLLIAIAFVALPPDVAFDVAWPSFVLESYRGWVTPEVRWPRWGGWSVLIGQYLSPLVGGGLGIFAVARYLGAPGPGRRPDPASERDADAIRLLLPLLFYLLASAALFRMVYHFFMFAWALVIPAAWAVERAGRLGRLAAAALLLPCFALNARSIFLSGVQPGQAPFRTPNGEVLWADSTVRRELDTLAARVRAAPAEGRAPGVVVMPIGAGFHHFYELDTPLRQAWYLPGLVRPRDDVQLVESLDRIGALVVRDPAPGMRPSDPCTWRAPSPLSPATCEAVARRLDAAERVGRFVIILVRPAERGGR